MAFDMKHGVVQDASDITPCGEGAQLLNSLLSKPRNTKPVDAELTAPARTRMEQYGDAVMDAFSDPANEEHLLSQGYTLEQLQWIRDYHAREGKYREPLPNPRDILQQSSNCDCRCCRGDE